MDPIIMTDVLLAVGTGTASADRDISARLRSLSWTQEYEDYDVTTMGSTNRVHALGLSDGTLDGELMDSYSTADGTENIDALIQTLVDLSASGKSFLVRMRPKNAAKNASNPEYSMLAKMGKQTIMDGEVADPQMKSFSIFPAGQITRSTASS